MMVLGRAWACHVAFAVLLALVGRRDHFINAALEVIESVVDRGNDGLHAEDIVEGFGGTPVSVEFSPVSNHMFIGFRAGQVRIYPDGGDTTDAAVYDSCIDMEDNVYENNDLGLLNFRLHPDWPDIPYGYFLYTHDPGYEDDCLVEPYFCEKDHRLARIEVDYDEGTDTVTCGAQAILINDWCTGSNHHGGGGMAFMENGDMALTVGDLTKAEQRVIGDEEGNTCFRDDIGLPQGYFRSILDDFNEGKLLRISADALVAEAPDTADTTGFLERDTDFWHEAKGLRNPFRLVVAPGSGDVIIADVGLDTAESLKVVPNPLEAAEGASMGNYGWPCMEGNAWIPPYLSLWLVESESDACDAIRGTTLGLPEEVDYDALVESALAGEVDWVPAAFTYRLDAIDSEYPDMCTTALASVTALHIYQGSYLPDRYSNVLFVGDFAKNCVFYFDMDDATGTFDWTTPHVLFDSRSVVDFTTDPKTGIMYAIDAKIAVLIKITVEDGITSAVSREADVVLEADVTEGMVPLEVTLNASASSDADGIVTVQWDCEGDGVLEAEGDWSVEASKTQVCTYDVDGTYEATVHLTNSLNATTSDSVEILVGDVATSTDAPTPAPTLAPTDAPVSTPAPIAAPVGNPLTSPPELQWEVDENGTRSGVLEFGVVEVDNFWGHTVTRGYNGQMPGPTMRMEACRIYELTLKNMLTLPNPGGEWNTMKDPNSTNIHTHGLHISGESPADDVLYVDVLPGEEHTYVYTLPCDHAGGTFWYHPHHHGSTALQIGGGAMGALIVEDRPDVHGIPDQYADMPEIIVTVQEVYPEVILSDQYAAGGTLFNTTATSRHYLVNGMVVPTIDLATGNWTRIRIAFAGQGDNHAISLQDPDGDCEMGVLAKDGVYLSEVPRMEPQLFFTPASRVDVAVRCSTARDYDVIVESVTSMGSDVTIAVLSVTNSSDGGADANLTTWTPCRPYYLQDLIDLEIENDSVKSVLVRETIGEESFKGPDDYLFNLSEGSVHQWLLVGSEQHPFHMHVNHMQFYDVDGPGLVPGWNHVGDWVDTVSTGLAVVRFRTERYGGHVAMHCHVNSHSDTGVMAVVNVIGGEGPNEDPTALAAGTCGTEGIEGYGYSLDEMLLEGAETPSPIVSPTLDGDLVDTEAPEDVSDESYSKTELWIPTPSPMASPSLDGDLVDTDTSGDVNDESNSEDELWIPVVAGGVAGLAGLGLLAVGLVLFFSRCRKTVIAQKTDSEVDVYGGEEKAETKAEKV